VFFVEKKMYFCNWFKRRNVATPRMHNKHKDYFRQDISYRWMQLIAPKRHNFAKIQPGVTTHKTIIFNVTAVSISNVFLFNVSHPHVFV